MTSPLGQQRKSSAAAGMSALGGRPEVDQERRKVRYRTRDEARADVFDYIEVFYNRKRRHGYLGNISPADFEERSAGSFETVH